MYERRAINDSMVKLVGLISSVYEERPRPDFPVNQLASAFRSSIFNLIFLMAILHNQQKIGLLHASFSGLLPPLFLLVLRVQSAVHLPES